MEKARAKRILSLWMLAMLLLALFPQGGASSYAQDKAVRETDVMAAANGNTLVYLDGTFPYLSSATILNRINDMRREACREGVPHPQNPSKRLTEADYVPLKWSSELEWIAQTRAAEATIHMDHQRPNGRAWNSVAHNGVVAGTENIAWNSGGDIQRGIDQWYAEKADWVAGRSNAVTGHYTALINPGYTHIGIGAFKPEEGYGSVTAELKRAGALDERQTGAQGAYRQKVEVKNASLSVVHDAKRGILPGESIRFELRAGTSYANTLGERWSPKTSVVSLIKPVYSSENATIASVDAAGNIKGNEVGTTVISASAGGSQYRMRVTVEEGHRWAEVYTVDREANCLQEGQESIHCLGCDAIKEDSVRTIPRGAHSFQEVVTPATLTKDGRIEDKCVTCGGVRAWTKIPRPKDFALEKNHYTYDGKAKKPRIILRDAEGKTIEPRYYRLTYSNNTKAGKNSAKVKLVFRDKYSGTKSLSFSIDKAKNGLRAKGKSVSVSYAKLKKGKQSIRAKKAFDLSAYAGKLTYKKDSGNRKISVSNTGKISLKKGLKKGEYKLKVKIKAAGDANHKAKTVKVTVKLKVK